MSEQQKRPPVWRLPPFVGLLCDPYIEGTGLEGGQHALYSLKTLEAVLRQIVAQGMFAGADSVCMGLCTMPGLL